ncbi:LysR family transcriptional regulator [Alicyclobacillus curvatus]|nr:LysR family transcriptional regulator [Alicyclobacillus curvatus]
MQIEWLQTFLAAAEEENFRRAADKLHLAQPTVTQHIRKLEELWGVQLFARVGQHVELSPGGRRFLGHAKRLSDTYLDSLEDMARWHQGYDTRVTIAVSPLVATSYLPRWMRAYTKTHRQIEFVVKVLESESVLEQISRQEADIGFSRLRPDDGRFDAQVLYADPVVFVAPAEEHDIDGPPQDSFDLLARHTVFTHCHPEYWPELTTNLRKQFPDLQTMVVSLVHVVVQWVGEGLGVSFLPQSTVQRELLRGNIEEVHFPLPLPTAQTHLVVARHASTAARDFADFITQYMRERVSYH